MPRPPPGVLLALAAFLASCGREPADARPPVVLFVVIDALSAQHVSHLGYHRETTPCLDALAADGVTFEQAIAPAAYTIASIPSILTGRLPDRHGVVAEEQRLPASEQTLAELLSAAGYTTVGITANAAGGSTIGADQGFDRFVETFRGRGPVPEETLTRGGETAHLSRAPEVIAAAIDALDQRAAGERLFLWVHLLEPHGPYDPPLEEKQRFVDEHAPEPYREGDRERLQARMKEVERLSREDGRPMDPEVVAGVKRLYDSNLRWADANVGRLLDHLRSLGLYDDALIVVTADHGEAIWQHGHCGHSTQVYEPIARVPMIVRLPDGHGPRGLRLPHLVSTVDLAPTLCDWMGLEPPDGLDGLSLARLVEDPDRESPRREIVTRTTPDRETYSLRTATRKLLLRVPRSGDPGRGRHELYDLTTDPGERTDLAAERPEEARLLRERLVAIVRALDGEKRVESATVGAAERELLEALGYGGGDGENEEE